jgi:hypothetical protein
VPAFGGIVRLMCMSGDVAAASDVARFLTATVPMVIHVIGATLHRVLVAFQLSAGFRVRWPRLHRRAGGVLALCGLLAGASGVRMTAFNTIPLNLQGPILFGVGLVVGSAMVASILIAGTSILRRT